MELRDAAVGTEQVLQLVHILLKQPLAGHDGGRAVRAAAPLVLLALGTVAGLAVLGPLFAIPELRGVARALGRDLEVALAVEVGARTSLNGEHSGCAAQEVLGCTSVQ